MQENNRNSSCKVVILGNSGVGKTSLINRWTTGVWNKSVKPTIGANHQRKTVDLVEKQVDVFVWDTAGQEQFQSLTPLYARSAACAIITTAINDRQSFESIQTWIELLKNACEKIPPLLLAVNKNDLLSSAVFTNDEIEQRYGKLFAATFYVSAQTGESVDGLFSMSASKGDEFNQGSKSFGATSVTTNVQKKSNDGCC